MKKHFRAFTSVVLFSLSPSLVLAQNLPDEIDHVRYRTALQGLQGRLSDARERLAGMEQERSNLRAEIERMTSDRRTLPTRNSELNSAIQSQQARISELDAEIRSLSTTIERINQDLRNIETNVNQLRASWNQEEQRRAAIATQLNSMIDDMNRLRGQLDREVGEERESMALLERTEREIDQLQRGRQALGEEHRQRGLRHQEEQRDLPRARGQAQQMEAQLQQTQGAMAQAEGAVAQANNELRAREAELNQASAQLAPFQQRVEGARNQVNQAQADLNAQERVSVEAEAAIRGFEQRRAGSAQQLSALAQARNTLSAQLGQQQASIGSLDQQAQEAQGALNAAQAELSAAQEALRQAQQGGLGRGELMQHVARVRQAEANLRNAQQNAARAGQAAGAARTAVAQTEAALAANQTQTEQLQSFLQTVDADIARERAKIEGNAAAVAQKREELNQKRQALAQAERELASASSERDRLAPQVAQARQQAMAAVQRRDQQAQEVQRLRGVVAQLLKRVEDMERSIASFQRDIREMENRSAQMAREIQQKAQDAERERRLLSRIREDRVRIQRQVADLDGAIQRASVDLERQEQTVGSVETALRQRENERAQLQSYVDGNRATMDAHVRSQAELRQLIQNEQNEIRSNTARLQTIERDFAGLQSRANQIGAEIPGVNQQITSLEAQTETANAQFRQRAELYNRYLGEAQNLGTSRGSSNGNAEGARAGVSSMNATAARLGTPNASEEGRFESLLRGFVRGEIAGYTTGRDQGLASAPDAARGTQEGTAAGAADARNHAEQVLKPRYYNTEFTRRLTDPSVRDEVVMKLAAHASIGGEEKSLDGEKARAVDPLSGQELSQAQAIRTSLDERIASFGRELTRIREEQTRLSNAQSVYLAPTDNRPTVDARTCEGVYKNVADFVTACQESYRSEYGARFVAAHRSNFLSGYTAAFQAVVQRDREAVIRRDYDTNFREAEGVARAAGLAVGKEEVYQQRFAAARTSSYQTALASEDQRVRNEAVTMVDQLFAANGVAILTETPKFKSAERFGVSPGAGVDVELLLKNAGAQATAEGAVKVRILEASPILVPARTLAPLKSLPARKLVRTSADFGFKVADQAAPGQKIRLAAEITYPGNDYAASRVERIEIEESLGLNPSANVDMSFDNTPETSGFLGVTKTHEIPVSVTAKYRGLDKGYEISLEEVGSNYVTFKNRTGTTAVLAQNASGRIVLKYQLNRSSRGKDVNLKVLVRYNGTVLEERAVTVKPH